MIHECARVLENVAFLHVLFLTTSLYLGSSLGTVPTQVRVGSSTQAPCIYTVLNPLEISAVPPTNKKSACVCLVVGRFCVGVLSLDTLGIPDSLTLSSWMIQRFHLWSSSTHTRAHTHMYVCDTHKYIHTNTQSHTHTYARVTHTHVSHTHTHTHTHTYTCD